MPKILILLIIITLSAWGVMIYQHWQMTNLPMTEMWMPPGSTDLWQMADFIIVYLMWAVMMAAMMLPSAMAMVKAFSQACQRRYGRDTPYTYLFSCAYLLVWFIFSIVLTLIQWQMHGLNWLSAMMENNNTLLAAGIFIVAGVYQFSALKNTCLRHCRLPVSFLLNFWRNGRSGAFSMGVIYGNICLGCCWAQMLIMFAVGVMNITAMILITLFILFEKSLPENKESIDKAAGVLFCLWGTGLLFC